MSANDPKRTSGAFSCGDAQILSNGAAIPIAEARRSSSLCCCQTLISPVVARTAAWPVRAAGAAVVIIKFLRRGLAGIDIGTGIADHTGCFRINKRWDKRHAARNRLRCQHQRAAGGIAGIIPAGPVVVDTIAARTRVAPAPRIAKSASGCRSGARGPT
jgi:hypothetical protein